MPVGDIPVGIIDDAVNVDNILADRVFNYMFTGIPRERDDNVWKFRWNNVKQIWREKWKYKDIYNMTPINFLYLKVLGIVLNEEEHD